MNKEDLKVLPRASAGLAGGLFKYYLRPELTAKRTWVAIGAVVLAHELLCPPGELLSEGADRAIDRHPVLIPVVTLAIAGHIANLLPQRLDPVHHGLKFIKAL